MRFIVRVVKKILGNLKCIWNIAPILMLLEVWALIRVIVILVLVAGVIIDSLVKGKVLVWIQSLF